ncbi:MAG TPA: hypothetical protein DD619_02300 [Alphaproteobacteria bacterium]|nr:hypothetical protein [Alphaproteobacteria bacterium]
MELYLLIALIFIYLITAAMVNKNVVHRIWTLAFIAAFVVTAIAIGFLRVTNQDVMMSADNLNWYYLLYIFGSMSVVLGVINLWMYRRPLWQILRNDNEADNKE